MSRAGEQRRRCQSMKSYPSSELRNVCEAQSAAVEPPEEGEDLLQQMLERRWDSHSHPHTHSVVQLTEEVQRVKLLP